MAAVKTSGGKRTAAARQRARVERLAADGKKLVRVVVPIAQETEIKAIAARMCEPRWERSFVSRSGNYDGYRFSDFWSGCGHRVECAGQLNYCAHPEHPDAHLPQCERVCMCELCPCVEIDIAEGDDTDYSEGDQPILARESQPAGSIVEIAREGEIKGIAERMVRESQEALQEIAYINTRIAECQYMIKYAEKHKDCESHMPQEWQEAIDKLLKKRNALSALIKEK